LSQEGIERLLQEDGNIKVIYKDFPKLGPLSLTAAIATLASVRQGADKYLKLHNILMDKDFHLTGEEAIYQTASSVGIDVDHLKKDMSDPAITQQIQENITLGKSIGMTVTPAFVIGGHLYSGVAPYERLKDIIDFERKRANQ
jgi:protein-disulfide isomerase